MRSGWHARGLRGIASILKLAVAPIVVSGVTACVSPGNVSLSNAWLAGSSVSDAGDFQFRSVLLADDKQGPLIVVIEGDGAAWQPSGHPPPDPTPRRAVGLAIAQELSGIAPVLYLARPCQFLERVQSCSPLYWTRKRFAPEVLRAYKTQIEANSRGRRVVFVGYSGGGVIAAELALSHPSTSGLLTLAAPLDLERWTGHFDVSPLESPSGAALLQRLVAAPWPQQHFFGGRDRIVPRQVSADIIARLGRDQAALIEGATHSGPWDTVAALAVTPIAGTEGQTTSP